LALAQSLWNLVSSFQNLPSEERQTKLTKVSHQLSFTDSQAFQEFVSIMQPPELSPEVDWDNVGLLSDNDSLESILPNFGEN